MQIKSYKESEKRRAERIQNLGSLRTRVVKSKKIYDRKKLKDLNFKNKENI